MKIETFQLMPGSEATLTTYILQDEEYGRKGTLRPAVIVCPGGGYTAVSQNEGEPVAMAFVAKGYHAFVLRYSVKMDNPFPQALLELAKAMSVVRGKAGEWRVIPDKVAVAGFSAGGHLAMSLGEFHGAAFLTKALGAGSETLRPDALVLGYPAFSLRPNSDRPWGELPQHLIDLMEKGLIMDFRGPEIRQILAGKQDFSDEDWDKVNLLKHTNENMPPLFMFGSFEDPIIPVSDLTQMAEAYKAHGIPCELHLFAKGPHGQGIYALHSTDAVQLAGNHMHKWVELAHLWLEELL